MDAIGYLHIITDKRRSEYTCLDHGSRVYADSVSKHGAAAGQHGPGVVSFAVVIKGRSADDAVLHDRAVEELTVFARQVSRRDGSPATIYRAIPANQAVVGPGYADGIVAVSAVLPASGNTAATEASIVVDSLCLETRDSLLRSFI